MVRGSVVYERPKLDIPDYSHLCSTKQLPSNVTVGEFGQYGISATTQAGS
jgi:hypothetical protein